MKSRLTFAEGAVLLVAVYALTGTGIGAVAGSAATGAIVGMTVGLFAAVAILLVSGASASSCAEGRARAAVTNLQDHRRWPPIVRQRSEVTTAVDR